PAGALPARPAAAERPRRDGRQVPGSGGAGRVLFDGVFERRRNSAGSRISLQPEPAERGDLSSARRRDRRREPAIARRALPDAGTDAAREHTVPARGIRTRGRVAIRLLALRRAACFPTRRALLRGALGRLGFGGVRRLAFSGLGPLAAAQAFRRGAQTAADARFGLRLLAFALRFGFRLRARVEFAADQLDLRHLGAVALPVAETQETRVAALPCREARRDRVEELRHDVAVLQVVHDETPSIELV